MYKRLNYKILYQRITEKRRFIQVLAGPRQTGKTTMALQLRDELEIPVHYVSSDEPALKDQSWIEQQWEVVRLKYKANESKNKIVLILDEIQKISNWSESAKRLWDEDTAAQRNIYVIILGSSPLLVKQGLTESLAGRFETIHVTHWSFKEMHEAFGWNVAQYIFYGGYPGAAELISDYQRWTNYLKESLIETTISRDILLMKRIDKPVLLRRLFELGCSYSGQVLSYQKMVGQLQDAGNTTTLAHYLELLTGAGLVMGVSKYAGQKVRQRASSPKLLTLNSGLMSVHSNRSFKEAQADTEYWGRQVEAAIGASLANSIAGKNMELYYWQERNKEVDFLLTRGKRIVVFEVKSNLRKARMPGIQSFADKFDVSKKYLIGGDGFSLNEFFLQPVEYWIE